MDFTAPSIDYTDLIPLMALAGGTVVVMFMGLLRDRVEAWVAPALSIFFLGGAMGSLIWKLGVNSELVAGTLALDDFGTVVALTCVAAAIVTVVLSFREFAAEQAGRADYYALLLCTVAGMVALLQANNLVVLFIAIELLSIPLYVLCAAHLRRERSLESGLKYLIVGSLGSAVLLYGLAFLYGAAGSTDLPAIGAAIGEAGLLGDPLVLIGVALVAAGLAFKASLAPFHQWTPDVYEGAPTPITAFMSVATKAAAFGVLVRVMDVALGPVTTDWQTALAILAVASIVVGNVGALGQRSVKRILAWSGIAQAGYLLVGLVVATELGREALVFYLIAYGAMTMAGFAVVVARERETGLGDSIEALDGIGFTRPALAWSMTISMIGLAGIPGTVGFIGKLFLIRAAVDGEHTWLAVAIVLGSAVSLVYYLRIVAAMWMRPGEVPAPSDAMPAMAGGAPVPGEEPVPAAATPARRAGWEVVGVAIVLAAATIVLGIVAQPLAELSGTAAEGLLGTRG